MFSHDPLTTHIMIPDAPITPIPFCKTFPFIVAYILIPSDFLIPGLTHDG